MKAFPERLLFMLCLFRVAIQAPAHHKTGVLTHRHTGFVYNHLYSRLIRLGIAPKHAIDILRNSTHVVSTYVDFIHAAGSTPVFLNFLSSWNEQSKVLEEVDAVLLPGGDMPLHKHNLEDNDTINGINPDNPGDYILRVGDILEKIRKINRDREIHDKELVNVLGICLGFEAILFYDSGYTLKYTNMNRRHMMDVVRFTEQPGAEPPAQSMVKSYRKLSLEYNKVANLFSQREIDQWESGPYAFYNHRKGFTMHQFETADHIKDMYRVAATFPHAESDGVAIVEGKLDPFYGVQFHPERASFERYKLFHTKKPYKQLLNRKFATLLTDKPAHNPPHLGKAERFRKVGNYYLVDVQDVSTYKRITVVSTSPDIRVFDNLHNKENVL